MIYTAAVGVEVTGFLCDDPVLSCPMSAMAEAGGGVVLATVKAPLLLNVEGASPPEYDRRLPCPVAASADWGSGSSSVPSPILKKSSF